MLKIVNTVAVVVFIICAAILATGGVACAAYYAAWAVGTYGVSGAILVVMLIMIASMVVGVFTS